MSRAAETSADPALPGIGRAEAPRPAGLRATGTRSRLDLDRAALLVVDVQEAFRGVIDRFEEVVDRIATLIQGARVLGLPIMTSEQYPKGLGATVPELASLLDEAAPRLEKTSFAATDAAGFDLGDRDQVILCGIEAHICVHQSAQALLAQGKAVHVVLDAVSSRRQADREVGVRRMEADGASVSSVEMALFELLRAAGGERFKAIQRLVK